MEYLSKSSKIESWASKFWKENKIANSKIDNSKPKEVILDFFPYPSGIGLHVGHTLGYIASDIYARFKKLQGNNVLYAMGFDSFGLPAEQFSIETGKHPEIITKQNIANMKSQLSLLGLMHDDEKSFSTTDPDYYKWTQWIFTKLYNSYFNEETKKAEPIHKLKEKLIKEGKEESEIKKILNNERLAYLDEVEVNWCPKLGTVLAQEEVIAGKSERGGFPVYKKPLKQWVLRITKYADRLLENLPKLNWPNGVKEMQKNWIGLSNGYEISFKAHQEGPSLSVYTTKPETLSGASFCAISIKHKKIKEFIKTKEAQAYYETEIEKAKKEQTNIIKNEPKGIFTGSFVENPLNGNKTPVFIADYVLDYGCAAVMGVPAHDSRDNKFAKKHELNFNAIIKPDAEFLKDTSINEFKESPKNFEAFDNFDSNSTLFNGRSVQEEIEFLMQNQWIKSSKNYRLRDWIFSRQRYWGEPFPIVFDENNEIYSIDESQLPIELPHLDNYKNEINDDDAISKPLDKAKDWVNVKFIKLSNGNIYIVNTQENTFSYENKEYKVHKGKRETNTMPNWAGSCWYYLRYMDSKNDEAFISREAEKYWGSPKAEGIGCVDLYLGGAEHAVLHLLYARFWHMVLFDLEYVSAPEPFERLFNQGMVLGMIYADENGKYYEPKLVKKEKDKFFVELDGNKIEVFESIGKLGKRYKNGVGPEEICSEYSADTLRLYMMYLGPLEENKPWKYDAIKGMSRLLEKLSSISISSQESSNQTLYDFDLLQEKVKSDIENLKLNTSIAALNIFIKNNEQLNKDLYKELLIIFSPFAPHLCEYLYNQNISNEQSIFNETWPKKRNIKKPTSKLNVPLTINGKKRTVLELDENITSSEAEKLAKDFCNKEAILVKKVIIIKDKEGLLKIINIAY